MSAIPPAPSALSKRCPICGKERVEKFRPFCSRRCADIDLARWLGGRYYIEGGPEDESDDEQETEPGRKGGETAE